MVVSKFSDQTAQNIALGVNGFTRISGTDQVVANFFALKAINGDAVLAVSGTDGTTTGDGDNFSDGDTILEGDIFFAPFTAVKLTSGVVLAYRG